MSALPPEQMRAMRTVVQQADAPADQLAVQLAERWEALHANAAQLATIANLSAEADNSARSEFAGLIEGASEWQCELARRAIGDIEAVMQIGMKALLTVTARGQNASAPALTLWREFYHARESVLALLRPELTDKAA